MHNIKDNLSIFKNSKFYVVVFLAVIFQVLLSFQGFDVCDEGFSLTFYQQIYHAPASVEYNFVYWLSGIIGGLWYNLNPTGGVLWFRFLAIIVNTTIFIISYRILKNYISEYHALVGLAIVLIINDFGFLAFYHNHLTALLAVISIRFLINGITKKHLLSLAVAGLICGINVFSRLPNITLFIFILGIPYFGWLNKEPLVKAIRPMLWYLLGILLGFIFVYSILYGLDQIEIMKNAMLSIVDSGKSSGSNHNVSSLFKSYIFNYKQVLIFLCKFLLIIGFVLGFKNSLSINRTLKILINVIGFILLVFFFKKGGTYIIYVMAFIGVFGILLTKQQGHSIKVLAFLALLMMVFLPLGSDGGIYNTGYIAVWLSLPLFFCFLSQINAIKFSFTSQGNIINRSISSSSIKGLITLIIFSYFTAKIYNISQEAYFDKGSRFYKTHTINSKFVEGIYTTKERAEIINDLLINLEKYVTPSDYLLAYDKIPMIHFLTETKPYMYNPWPWIYDSYSFSKNLKRAEKEIEVLPVIVQQKFETIGSFGEPSIDYMSVDRTDGYTYSKGRMKAINNFIKNNEYEIVWSNKHFNIYQSKKRL